MSIENSESNPTTHYPKSMRVLHWTVALLVICVLVCGLLLGYGVVKGDSPTGHFLMSLHVGCAMLSLCLWFVRFVVRGRCTVPNAIGTPVQKRAAHVSHVSLYVLTLALPLSGYAMDLAYGALPDSFGIEFPGFGMVTQGQVNEPLGEKLWLFHSYAGQGLALLVLIHLAAAIWRSMKSRNDGIWRMLAPRSK